MSDEYIGPRDLDRPWDWEKNAKCFGKDTNIFYPERNRETYHIVAGEAKSVCFGRDGKPPCPVRATCLTKAIERDELFGIWGGLSHRERNALMRKLNKQSMPLTKFLEGAP